MKGKRTLVEKIFLKACFQILNSDAPRYLLESEKNSNFKKNSAILSNNKKYSDILRYIKFTIESKVLIDIYYKDIYLLLQN